MFHLFLSRKKLINYLARFVNNFTSFKPLPIANCKVWATQDNLVIGVNLLIAAIILELLSVVIVIIWSSIFHFWIELLIISAIASAVCDVRK